MGTKTHRGKHASYVQRVARGSCSDTSIGSGIQFCFLGVCRPTHIPTQAGEIALLAEEQEQSQEEGDGSAADIAELNALTAAAMLKEAERLENAAREAGAFPKGW